MLEQMGRAGKAERSDSCAASAAIRRRSSRSLPPRTQARRSTLNERLRWRKGLVQMVAPARRKATSSKALPTAYARAYTDVTPPEVTHAMRTRSAKCVARKGHREIAASAKPTTAVGASRAAGAIWP